MKRNIFVNLLCVAWSSNSRYAMYESSWPSSILLRSRRTLQRDRHTTTLKDIYLSKMLSRASTPQRPAYFDSKESNINLDIYRYCWNDHLLILLISEIGEAIESLLRTYYELVCQQPMASLRIRVSSDRRTKENASTCRPAYIYDISCTKNHINTTK